jgi:hypothetical protein
MPQEIAQPATVRASEEADAAPVRIIRIDIPFNDVFELVFMIVVAQVLLTALIGIVVGAILVYTGVISL